MFAHDLSTERQQSIAAVNSYVCRGGTALYDGLTDALGHLQRIDGRKAVVLLSDGRDEDNAGTGPGSIRTQEQLFAALGESEAVIYPIGLGPRVDRALLERLAAKAGGLAYFPDHVSTLPENYARVIEGLRRRYVVSYTSTNPARDGGWRAVEIKTRETEVTVWSRGGYSAPEQ